MSRRPTGPLRMALLTLSALAVALGVFGVAAFSPLALGLAWFMLTITVALIGGVQFPAPVLGLLAALLIAGGLFFGMTAGSLIGLGVSITLFWLAGVCLAFAAHARAMRRGKMVRS